MTLKDMITACELIDDNLEFGRIITDDGKWFDIRKALHEIGEELKKRRWIPGMDAVAGAV